MPEKAEGLARVQQILQDRFAGIKDLKAQGKKTAGYFCSYVPVEILTALDIAHFRITGDLEEPVTAVEKILPASFCPFMRNCIDSVFKGKYDFLDGMVGAHSCDAQEKSIHVWKSRKDYEYYHYFDMPATTHEWGIEMFRQSLEKFKTSAEAWVGRTISNQDLKAAIDKHNRLRELVREFYNLKRVSPPPISGTETLKIMIALASITPDQGLELMGQVLAELRERKGERPDEDRKRILVYGACLDALPLIKLIEDYDADVVMDDHCMGPRTYFRDVPVTDDPMDGLARRYANLTCARTFREASLGELVKNRQADLETRFAHLGKYLEKWDVEGVVIQLVRFCDPFGYEVPELKDYLNSLEVPNIYMEMEYNSGSLAPLKTRVQTFLENLL